MNTYLIPANSKKGQLIFNVFRGIDLGILCIGAIGTVFLLFLLPGQGAVDIFIKLGPVGICLLLVMPLPYYHNVLVYLQEMYRYYSNPRRYYWRGWCAWYDGESDKKAEGKR